MKNKIYDNPIAFDVDMPVKGLRRFVIYARSEEEAIEKADNNALELFDTEYFEELEWEKPYVVNADEGNTHPKYCTNIES